MGNPRICVSVRGENTQKVIEEIDRIEDHGPNYIEVRLDYAHRSLNLYRIREATSVPLIATNRGKRMRGHSCESDEERLESLRNACYAGFDIVDLSQRNPSLPDKIDILRETGVKVILSYHDHNRTPDKKEMSQVYCRSRDYGCNICKIVGTAKRHEDNLKCLNFLAENKNDDLICFAMGKMGLVSRILSPLYGGFLTYASAKAGRETAEGQLSIKEFIKVYNIIGV
ncbi:MAG: type I 3-dehydroquinate dehydratase [Candidatus Bathyarchaeia archaeon]